MKALFIGSKQDHRMYGHIYTLFEYAGEKYGYREPRDWYWNAGPHPNSQANNDVYYGILKEHLDKYFIILPDDYTDKDLFALSLKHGIIITQ